MFRNIKVKALAVSTAVTGVLVAAQPAMAEGVADTAVTGAMTTISDNIMATMAAVGPIAIVIFGVFLAWRFGKKIFRTVAN